MARLLFLDQRFPQVALSAVRDTIEEVRAGAVFSGRDFRTSYLPMSRAGDAFDPSFVPKGIRVNARLAPNTTGVGEVTPDMHGPVLSDYDGNLFANGAFRKLVERFDPQAVEFVPVPVIQLADRAPFAGDWSLIVFRKHVNVVLEARSNLFSVFPNVPQGDGPQLFAHSTDVEGLHFWCGAQTFDGQHSHGVTPDRVSNPHATYCSDAFFEAMEAEGLIGRWTAHKIKEIAADDSAQAPMSPNALRASAVQSSLTVSRLSVPGLTTQHSSNWTSALAQRLKDPAAGGALLRVCYDAELPPLDLFEFQGHLFCSPKFQEVLGPEEMRRHRFIPVELFGDPDLSQPRMDMPGFGVLVVDPVNDGFVPALAEWTEARLAVTGPVMGMFYYGPKAVMALDARIVKTRKLWRHGGALTARGDLLEALSAQGIKGPEPFQGPNYKVWDNLP